MKKRNSFLSGLVLMALVFTQVFTPVIADIPETMAASTIQTIIQDSFSGTGGDLIAGRVPDGTNLPGGSWQVDQYNRNGTGSAKISTTEGNVIPSMLLSCGGNSSVAGAVSISSSGTYTKPAQLTIQADLHVSGMSNVTLPPHGAMLGFYATPPATGTDPISGFTGLVLQMDGSLVLVESGTMVSTINYTGTFNASSFNTLSYSIDTMTGAISNVQLTGSTSNYNFTSLAFTNSATDYAAAGARNSFGRDQRAYVDNFMVTTTVSDTVINIATNKTASADSTLSGHDPARGNDEDTVSYWSAGDANANHWWKTDLNGSYNLTGTEILFQKAANYKYKIEVSADNTNWTLAADNTATTSTYQSRTDNFTANNVRYIRITVTGVPSGSYAAFYEFKAFTSNASGETYFTIESTWKKANHTGYIYDNNGTNVAYNNSVSGDKYRWCFEDAGNGYFRIKNKATGNYLNIASGETSVKCSAIAPDDITGHWTVAQVSGNTNKYLKNRSNGKYLNIESQLGYVTCDIAVAPSGGNFVSGQWTSYYDCGSPIPVTGVTIDAASATITGYKTKQLTAILSPVLATIPNVTWTSSSSLIASVFSSGLVIANNIGNSTITVTTQDGGYTSTSQITVSPVALTGISISPVSATMNVGDTQQLTPVMTPSNATNKVVSYSSSNTAVTTVSDYGVVTAVGEGNAVITAATHDGSKTAACNVTVAAPATGIPALRAVDFLNSIGVCTHISQGEDSATQVASALAYTGIRNIRDDFSATKVQDFISIYNQTGAKINLLGKNGDVPTTLSVAGQLAAAGALLAIEGPNEPNNWPVTYEGQKSGYTTTFMPVARFQRDLYAAVKTDANLTGIPVFNSSEAGGSEPDNVGLQFNTILGSSTLMPAGTQYADYANCHNYVSRRGSITDNVSWDNFSPTLNAGYVDGMYAEYGITWHMGYQGYTVSELPTVPRVCTETGWVTSGTGSITQEQQGRLFLTLYPAAFKQGWKHTFVYMLRDSTAQGYWGFVDTSYTPKTSGVYMHNLTSILADTGSINPGRLNYSIQNQPSNVHELLLQKSNGKFALLVWSEKASGSVNLTVDLGSSYGAVNVYDPTAGTAAIQTLSNASSVPVTLTGYDLRIIEL